jgi:hypothetical protein
MPHKPNIIHQDGDLIDAPLNKLKKSPRNARRLPMPTSRPWPPASTYRGQISR